MPVLQHDPTRPEDLDAAVEDHIADETRYACLSRAMPNRLPAPVTRPADLWGRRREPPSWIVL